jgi:hypothetical protein
MIIYCCGCNKDVDARLTNGEEVYPHREDLYNLPFWVCDICNNFVGCHHKTENRTRPLGCIPTLEVKRARMRVHSVLDPIWRNKLMSRSKLYRKISDELGWRYHTAGIRNVQTAERVIDIINNIVGGSDEY